MNSHSRYAITILAAGALLWAGCKEKPLDSTTVSDPVEVVQAPPGTDPPISGEFGATDLGDVPDAAGEDTVAPEGQKNGGSELQAILQRLDRLEQGQKRARQALAQSGLPVMTRPELDDDLRQRVRAAQRQLAESKEGVAGLPEGEGLTGMLDLMSTALTELTGVEPCPPPGYDGDWLASAQQRIDDARGWVLGPPGSPDPDLLLALLDTAQEKLDNAKSGACVGE